MRQKTRSTCPPNPPRPAGTIGQLAARAAIAAMIVRRSALRSLSVTNTGDCFPRWTCGPALPTRTHTIAANPPASVTALPMPIVTVSSKMTFAPIRERALRLRSSPLRRSASSSPITISRAGTRKSTRTSRMPLALDISPLRRFAK